MKGLKGALMMMMMMMTTTGATLKTWGMFVDAKAPLVTMLGGFVLFGGMDCRV